MDLREIIDPLVEATTWTFDNLLAPLTEGNRFNILAIILIVGGLGFWVVLQGKYNKKADAEKGIR